MGRVFQPARVAEGEVPYVQSVQYKTGEAIIRGSVVLVDANGQLNLAGADPASIYGVALEPAGSKPGFDAANSPTVVTGRVQEVSTAVASRLSIFSGRMEDGSGNIVAPLQTHIGEQYGIAKDANGEWFIDESETTNKRVQIIDIDTVVGVHLFKFLEANLQQP